MMPKKIKKMIILVIILFILLIMLTTGGVFAYLYLKTDLLKSNQTLFEKYLGQNISIATEFLKQESNELMDFLNQNKYTSNTTVNFKYTSGIGTTAENNDSNINNVSINVDSQVDKSSNYNYKNIRLAYTTEDIGKLEYIEKDDLKGLRIDGIKEFTTIRNNEISAVTENLGIEGSNIEAIWMMTQNLSFNEIFNFTNEELQNLQETYKNLIEKNTSKESFGKYQEATINLNNNQTVANGYYLELTKEQYYSLLIEIINTLSTDEIILSKIDNIENTLKQYGINNEKSYREILQEYVNKYIEEIKSKNIGNEIFKISVYEQNGNTVKTSIETDEGSFTIDIYNENKSIKIDKINSTDEKQKRQIFTAEKQVENTSNDFSIEYIDYENGVEKQRIIIKDNKQKNNNDVKGSVEIGYELENCSIDIKADEYIKLANEFENPVELNEDNNIVLNDLSKEQTEKILSILTQNIQNQMNIITEKLTAEDINEMLKSLGFIKEDIIKIEEPVEVTETERNRFNSTLTLFIGENMSVEDIKKLLETVQSNLQDAEITQEEGKLQQITLNIERDTGNSEKNAEILTTLEENKNKKFNVTMSYDENTKLINRIFIKVN